MPMSIVHGKVRGPAGATFEGHRVTLLFHRKVALVATAAPTPDVPVPVPAPPGPPPNGSDPSANGFAPPPAAVSAATGEDGRFTLDVPPLDEIVEPIEIVVNGPSGVELARKPLVPTDLGKAVVVSARPEPAFPIRPSTDPTLGQRVRLQGRVINERGRMVPAGLPVVIWGVPAEDGGEDGDQDETVVAAVARVVTDTQLGGYFAGSWPADDLAEAYGTVKGGPPLAIPLVEDRLPTQVVLVTTLDDDIFEDTCSCDDVPPCCARPIRPHRQPGGLLPGPRGRLRRPHHPQPRAGGVRLLPGGAHLGARDQGCHPRRAHPRPGQRQDQARPGRRGRGRVRHAGPAGARPGGRRRRGRRRRRRGGGQRHRRGPDPRRGHRPQPRAHRRRAEHRRAGERHVRGRGRAPAPGHRQLPAPRAGPGPARRRHAVDWDDTPTVYQATTDRPRAPPPVPAGLAGRRLLARRPALLAAAGARPEASDRRGRLGAAHDVGPRARRSSSKSASTPCSRRDRDVLEIVGSQLCRGGARAARATRPGASAGGIGAGLHRQRLRHLRRCRRWGQAASARARGRTRARTLAANSLQQLRDRVDAAGVRRARASARRSSRPCARARRVRAETEVVANYNHCHALTIEYFEVLRHFLVTPRAGRTSGSACSSRCRSTRVRSGQGAALARAADAGSCASPSSAGGFAAMERIADNWVGWDFPESRLQRGGARGPRGRAADQLPAAAPARRGGRRLPGRHVGAVAASCCPSTRSSCGRPSSTSGRQADRDRVFRPRSRRGSPSSSCSACGSPTSTETGAEVEVASTRPWSRATPRAVPLYVSAAAGRDAADLRPRGHRARSRSGTTARPLPPDARVIVHAARFATERRTSRTCCSTAPGILDDLGQGDAVVVSTPLAQRELREPARGGPSSWPIGWSRT